MVNITCYSVDVELEDNSMDAPVPARDDHSSCLKHKKKKNRTKKKTNFSDVVKYHIHMDRSH